MGNHPSPPFDSRRGFPGKVAVQQRVLPEYRIPFFDRLSAASGGGLELFAGKPRTGEGIVVGEEVADARLVSAKNVHIGRGGLYLCYQRGLKSWLKRFQPDVLVVAADPRLPATRSAVSYMKSINRPVVGWGLGVLDDGERGGLLGSLRRRMRSQLFRSFDAVIGYGSKAAMDYEQYGVEPDRIFVAKNAVADPTRTARMDVISTDQAALDRWRARLGLSRPTILYVGRLIKEKRLDMLIGACSRLGDTCDLVIAGDGPDRGDLEQLANSEFPRAKFIGHVTGDELTRAFGASDLFVMPGLGGLAVQEAMAHGKPVIVAEADGTQLDLVKNGRNGLIVKPGDAIMLENAIRDCLLDPEALDRMGKESLAIATGEITIDSMVSVFVDVFRTLAPNVGDDTRNDSGK